MITKPRSILLMLLAASQVMIGQLPAQETASLSTEPTGESAGVSLNYRLRTHDRISVEIFEEPYLNVAQGIDAYGNVRLPLIGELNLLNLTLRQAEQKIEKTYREELILKNPIATVKVINYSAKKVAILGAVPRPGEVDIPPEVSEMDIVELFAKVGGLLPISKGDKVRVTRTEENGKQIVFFVDVERMIEGDRRKAYEEKFYVKPGDLIYVEERLI